MPSHVAYTDNTHLQRLRSLLERRVRNGACLWVTCGQALGRRLYVARASVLKGLWGRGICPWPSFGRHWNGAMRHRPAFAGLGSFASVKRPRLCVAARAKLEVASSDAWKLRFLRGNRASSYNRTVVTSFWSLPRRRDLGNLSHGTSSASRNGLAS